MAAVAGYFSNLIWYGEGSVRRSLKEAAKNSELLTTEQIDRYFRANISEAALKDIFETCLESISRSPQDKTKYIALKCIACQRKERDIPGSREKITLDEIKNRASIFWMQPKLLDSVKKIQKDGKGEINLDVDSMSQDQLYELMRCLPLCQGTHIQIGEATLGGLQPQKGRASFEDLKKQIKDRNYFVQNLYKK